MKTITLWLCLLAAVFFLFQKHYLSSPPPENLIQAKQPDDAGRLDGLDGLAYLNLLRRQAGVKELAHSAKLEQSARNHARYLLDYPDAGHDETHSNSPFFTGKRALQRTQHVNYLYTGVQENVSTGGLTASEHLSENQHQVQQINGLMTAIYHRFSLLAQNIDEAGVAYEANQNTKAIVVNQGNSRFNRLCALDRHVIEPGRRYYQGACHSGAIVYEDEVSRRKEALYVVYPVGKAASPDFHGERPDPMPGYDITGNPVSVAFSSLAGRIDMRSFKLYQGKEVVSPVRVLTKYNDPNQEFTEQQFALFPLQPLAFDTEYRAVFEYERQGKKDKIQWTFRTKRPDFPYFIVKGGEQLAVKAGQPYFIHWQNDWCMKDCTDMVYRKRGGAEMKIIERQTGGIVVVLTGSAGASVRVHQAGKENQAVELFITD